MSTEAPGALRLVKAVEWTLDSPGRLHRTVTTLPRPTVDEVLVATRLGAISPGSERALLQGICPRVPLRSYPYQPGYLNVVSIEEAPDRTLVGDRGVARLGHRDHALIPYPHFIRIPPGAADEIALLGVLAADAQHALDVAALESDEDCLILGGGITGVLTAWEASLRTQGAVRLVERDGGRRKLLEGIRFPSEVKVSSRAGKYPFHTVFECANTASAFSVAQEAVRPGGSIVVVSDGCHEKYELSTSFFSSALYLGKTGSHPDLRRFMNDWMARTEDRSTLVATAFRQEVRFDEFPQAYLKSTLAGPEDQRGLVPRVVY